MSYKREIPRDLFNEANLLKCYGRIWINLETANLPHVQMEHDGGPFDVQQTGGCADLTVANVKLKAGGQVVPIHRPANSREAWSLYITDDGGDEIELFDEQGDFSPEALEFFESKAPHASHGRLHRP